MTTDFPVIDTHQHLWDPAAFRYSWMNDFPTIRRRMMIEEYRQALEGANVAQTVYVDTDVDEVDLAAEIEMIFSLAEDPANRIGGIVAGAKLETPDFFTHLEKYTRHPKLKGLRRVLHTQPDELSQTPQFIQNVESLSSRGLSFDLCVLPRQLPLALRLVQKCPAVTFVLDHCGVPDVKGQALDPWREGIRLLAAEPNITCKVSGLVAYADPEKWTVDDFRPFVGHVIECFGWNRVMWGGDWPVCTLTATLRQWLDAALSLTSAATCEQRENFFGGNAVKIYRLTI